LYLLKNRNFITENYGKVTERFTMECIVANDLSIYQRISCN